MLRNQDDFRKLSRDLWLDDSDGPLAYTISGFFVGAALTIKGAPPHFFDALSIAANVALGSGILIALVTALVSARNRKRSTEVVKELVIAERSVDAVKCRTEADVKIATATYATPARHETVGKGIVVAGVLGAAVLSLAGVPSKILLAAIGALVTMFGVPAAIEKWRKG